MARPIPVEAPVIKMVFAMIALSLRVLSNGQLRVRVRKDQTSEQWPILSGPAGMVKGDLQRFVITIYERAIKVLVFW